MAVGVFDEVLKRARLVVEETFRSFIRNNDAAAASSLAFFAGLSLIPALFLVTYLLGLTVGSSQAALTKVQQLLQEFLPAYSREILNEVRRITTYKGTIGIVNGAALLLSITPLASSLREELGTIFRRRPHRPFLLEKLYDLLLTVVFLTGLAAIGAIGVVITILRNDHRLPVLTGYAEGIVPVLFFVAAVFLLYLAFSEGMPKRYLLAGAALAALLWFQLRPLFHLFLTYNTGFGFAFGSFKSLFVVMLWLYYSLLVFLLGAELAGVLDRRELVVLRRLTEKRGAVPRKLAARSTVRCAAGEDLFSEGENGDHMFYLLSGKIALRQAGREIATVVTGQYVGVVSFLLGTPRTAAAVALEDCELVAISRTNLIHLMQDSPDFILSMLREVALRLREMSKGTAGDAE